MKYALGLMLLSALFLAACDSNNTPVVNPMPALNTLSGTLVEGKFAVQEGKVIVQTSAWTGGAGDVTFNAVDEVSQPVELGRTALAADGKFSFASLPTPGASTLSKIADVSEICINGFTISDSAALSASAALFTRAQKNVRFDLIAYDTLNNGVTTARTGTLIYVDRAVTVKGSQTCTIEDQTLVADFDLALAKGWNMTTSTLNAGSKTFTVRNGSPAGAQWIDLQTSEKAAGLSLHDFMLR